AGSCRPSRWAAWDSICHRSSRSSCCSSSGASSRTCSVMPELTLESLHALLEQIGERYGHATRMSRELRTRLEALETERRQWIQAFAEPSIASRARMEP